MPAIPKDLQALDTVASAVTTAVADKQIVTSSGGVTFSLTNGSAWANSGVSGISGAVTDAVKTTLGEAVPNFSSNNAKDKNVSVFINTKDNVIYVYLEAGADDTHTATGVKVAGTAISQTVAACRYNDNAVFCISNTKVEGKGKAKN